MARDKGIDKGLVHYFDDSKREYRGQGKGFFGFRKMFTDYLTKLHVAYFDACCPSLTPATIFPVRYNDTTGVIEFFDPTVGADGSWVAMEQGAINGLNTFDAPVVQNALTPTGSPINATATATAAQVKTGLITSTSAAATSITLPTATLLGTALGAVKGTSFEFIVDNSAGANTVTVILGAGMTIATPIITGGNTLTVPSGAAGVGIFRIVFKNATTSVVFRIG